MTEQVYSISDQPAALQIELDAAQAHIRDLERQVEETSATAEELQRAFACLKEEYLILGSSRFRVGSFKRFFESE